MSELKGTLWIMKFNQLVLNMGELRLEKEMKHVHGHKVIQGPSWLRILVLLVTTAMSWSTYKWKSPSWLYPGPIPCRKVCLKWAQTNTSITTGLSESLLSISFSWLHMDLKNPMSSKVAGHNVSSRVLKEADSDQYKTRLKGNSQSYWGPWF